MKLGNAMGLQFSKRVGSAVYVPPPDPPPAEPAVVTRGLVAQYKFDAGSGQVLTDYSGNGNHGQLGSSAGGDTNDPAWNARGLSFASDDYVDCGANATLDITGNFTFEVVFKAPVTTGYLFSKNTSAVADMQYGVYWNSSQSNIIVPLNGVADKASDANSVPSGTTVYLAVTYDKSNISFFINGAAKGQVAYTSPITSGLSKTLNIGRRKASAYFNSEIYYIAIYNDALTVDERSLNYTKMKAYMAARGIVLP